MSNKNPRPGFLAPNVPLPHRSKNYILTGGDVKRVMTTAGQPLSIKIGSTRAVIDGRVVSGYEVAGYSLQAAESGKKRIDTVFISRDGFMGVSKGVAGANYSVPISCKHAVLATIHIPADATSITENAIHTYDCDVPFPTIADRPRNSLHQKRKWM